MCLRNFMYSNIFPNKQGIIHGINTPTWRKQHVLYACVRSNLPGHVYNKLYVHFEITRFMRVG
jgi:hypothetical protein